MTKDIYNEGRVVGLSSYEEYVRQIKSVDADFDVCTEREWLAASLAMGSSMVLKIPKSCGTKLDSGMYMYEVASPEGCHIGAGNTIQASYFYGQCEVDSKGWGTLVTDYGSLICNTSASSPANTAIDVNATTVPKGAIVDELSLPTTQNMGTISYKTQHKRLNEYIKIVDGLVVQPGYWKRSSVSAPYKDFTPDLNKKPVVRITFMEEIKNDFYILLTGFTNRSILRGISKFDFGATQTENKPDGDFLGCEAYPWACKIQFVSSPAVDYLMKSSIKSGSRNVKVETYSDSPLIKITSNNLLNTAVYSRTKNTTTGTAANHFNKTKTVWKGTNDPSHWYSGDRKTSVVSTCSDPNSATSGKETVETYDLKNPNNNTYPLGFQVENKYQSDDKNVINNGQHGGWYDVKIDPYQLIQDLIDEMFARFQYIDTRLSEIEDEIGIEIDRRKTGDKYILNKLYNGEGGLNDLLKLVNEFLSTVYNYGDNISITQTGDNITTLPSGYDETTGIDKSTNPSYTWKVPPAIKGKNQKIPVGNLNVYSGDKSGLSATAFIRSRSDDTENDLYAK